MAQFGWSTSFTQWFGLGWSGNSQPAKRKNDDLPVAVRCSAQPGSRTCGALLSGGARIASALSSRLDLAVRRACPIAEIVCDATLLGSTKTGAGISLLLSEVLERSEVFDSRPMPAFEFIVEHCCTPLCDFNAIVVSGTIAGRSRICQPDLCWVWRDDSLRARTAARLPLRLVQHTRCLPYERSVRWPKVRVAARSRPVGCLPY